MIKIKPFAVAMCLVSVLALVSCKSTPTEEPVEPVEDVTEEPVVEEVNDVSDFSASNKALMEKIEAARKAAIDSGADSSLPEAFKACEAEYEAEKLALKTNSDKDLTKALQDLLNRYNALEAYSNAKAKKERIDSLGFASYDQASYNNGSALLEELSDSDSLISLGSNWYKKAASAEESFDKVLDLAFRALAREERTLAFAAKKDADSVKAAVSKKDEYNKGVDAFKKGDSQYVTGDPEGSLHSYTSAKEIFTALYSQISEARAKAQAALEAAKARVAESEDVALEADKISPLGDEEVEGIEDEDSTLLESDDFTEAETQAQELEDSVDENVSEVEVE